jgi:hypothetical protein
VQRFVTEQQPVVHGGEDLVDRGGDVDPGVQLASLYPRPQQADPDLPARVQPLLVQCGADVRVSPAGGHQIGHQRLPLSAPPLLQPTAPTGLPDSQELV